MVKCLNAYAVMFIYAVWQEVHTCSGLALFGMACLLYPSNALSPGACLLPALPVILVHLKGITCRVPWLTVRACVKHNRMSVINTPCLQLFSRP